MRKVAKTRKDMPRVSWFIRVFLISYRLFTNITLVSSIGLLSFGLWFYSSGEYDRLIEGTKNKTTDLCVNMGLTLQHIYLEGQQYTDSRDIETWLNYPKGTPLMSIPIHDIKRDLENISWIKHAIVERLLPSTLSVHIIERTPMALWQHKGQVYLIDEDGVVIHEDRLDQHTDLIIMVGENIPDVAKEFLHMLIDEPTLQSMVSSAIRVGKRRWDIRLHNGIEVSLPEKHPEKAWSYLARKQEHDDILENITRYVDLRIEGKMFLQ